MFWRVCGIPKGNPQNILTTHINLIADRFGANDVHLWNGKFVLQLSPKSLIRSTQDRMMDNDVQSVSIPEDLEIKILYPPNNEEKIDVSNW